MIKYLLPLLLLSCTLEEVEPEAMPEEVVTVIDEPIQQAILQGVYKRSIGSQFEVYEITDKLTVYIETDGIWKQIFQADYTYSVRTYFIDKDWKYYHTLPSYDDMLFKYPFKWNYKKEYIKTIKL